MQLPQQEAAKLIKLILYSSTKIINCIRALSVSFDHRLTTVCSMSQSLALSHAYARIFLGPICPPLLDCQLDPSMPDIDPQALTEVIAGVIHRTYANWCDEYIPTLDNKTPRQAIQSAAGVERVKGLLRSYEFSEKEQARQQGRTEVSYDFLWAAIGLSR